MGAERRDEPELSIVLPCWNEGQVIVEVLRGCVEAARGAVTSHEIVIVDDGSTDDTWSKILLEAGDQDGIRPIRHPKNRGYGAALRTGFAECRGRYVLYADSDGQFDFCVLPAITRLLGPEVFVCPYRSPRRDPMARRVLGRAWSGLADRILHTGVRDVNCAFKAFPRALVEGDPFSSRGACISAELVSRARVLGLRVVEIPIAHRPRAFGRPSGAFPSVVARALREMAALSAVTRGDLPGILATGAVPSVRRGDELSSRGVVDAVPPSRSVS